MPGRGAPCVPAAAPLPPRRRRPDRRRGERPAAASRPRAALFHGSLVLSLLLLLAASVRAVSDGSLEPVSTVKWMYGLGGVFFVFLVMPPGIFGGRDGVDPVIAFTVCWTIIGCWTLRGIAN
jgi:hypothetical protein